MERNTPRYNFPHLVYEDAAGIERTKAQIETIRQGYARLIHEYRILCVGQFKADELPAMMENPAEFVRQKCITLLPAEAPTYGQFKVKQEVLLDQLELPDSTNLAHAVKFLQAHQTVNGRTVELHTAYEVQGDTVIAKKDFIQQAVQQFKIYANNETEVGAALVYKNYQTAYNALEKFMRQNGQDGFARMQPQQLFEENPATGEKEFKPAFYLRLIGQ